MADQKKMSLKELKELAQKLGVETPKGHKGRKATWIDSIEAFSASYSENNFTAGGQASKSCRHTSQDEKLATSLVWPGRLRSGKKRKRAAESRFIVSHLSELLEDMLLSVLEFLSPKDLT